MSTKLRTLALLPFLALFLTACSVAELPLIGRFFDNSNEPVTLTVWGVFEDPEVMNALAQKYQEQNPNVTIVYEDRSVMSLQEYKERVVSRAAGTDGDFDIALVHNSWVPAMRSTLAPAPSELLDAPTYAQNFYPAAVVSAVSNNEVYASPAYYDGLVLVYNKDHFAEVGQRFPPTAWEEFRRLALELTIRSGNGLVRGGAAIGAADNIDHFSDILGLMWSQAGVSIPSEVDSKAAQDALTFYTNFVKEDRVWDDNMPEATSAFVGGKASMIFVPSWQILDILDMVSDVNAVGVAPVPQALPDNPKAWGSFWMYVVPQGTEKAPAAWNFLNFLAQEEQQLMYFSEASEVRAFGPPYALASLAGQTTNPYITPVLNIAPIAETGIIAGRAGNSEEDALRDAVESVLSGASATNALTEFKKSL